MDLRQLLAELEAPPPGCDLVDVDKLLTACDYGRHIDEENDTIVYFKHGWKSYLTFPRSKSTVPGRRLAEIVALVKWHLGKEGMI